MDDKRYLRLLFRAVTGRWPDLDNPSDFNEKLQWLKMHDKNPAYPRLVDKIAVRDYVSERAGEKFLIPLLGVWDDPEDIDFSALPDKFVLKCTHDSGSAILCNDKNTFDQEAARRALKKKLSRDYSIPGREWPYANVPRRVIAEAFLGSHDGRPPMDFKFFCFDGKARAILVCTSRNGSFHLNFGFNMDFKYVPLYRLIVEADPLTAVPRPPHLEQMVELAETLSAGFKHMRVDLYDTLDGVRFGEITLHSSSGLSQTMTVYGDSLLGEYLSLEL